MYPPSLTPPPLPSLAGPHCPLQFNNFVGALPSNLSDLTHLIAFSCAQNALSGPIPSAPFSGFNPSAYSGNTGLCGPPLQPCSGTALPLSASPSSATTPAPAQSGAWGKGRGAGRGGCLRLGFAFVVAAVVGLSVSV